MRKIFQRWLETNEDKLLFFKALFLNPRATGAILPSSKKLANAMAAEVSLSDKDILVELGPGTGVVTNALINIGIDPDQIFAIENSPFLAEKLQKNFPRIHVIQGNAAELTQLIGENVGRVNTIISSLPFRSLPKGLSETILAQVTDILPSGGKYIQYTYSFRENASFGLRNFTKKYSRIIWQNIPPAKIEIFIK